MVQHLPTDEYSTATPPIYIYRHYKKTNKHFYKYEIYCNKLTNAFRLHAHRHGSA